jgi:DNA mismatch repair protein MSH3
MGRRELKNKQGLSRLCTGRLKPNELVQLLLAFQRIGTASELPMDAFASPLLTGAVQECVKIRTPSQVALSQLSAEAARDNRLADLFLSGYDAKLDELRDDLHAADTKLQSELTAIRKLLKKPSLMWLTVAEEAYLVEVTHREAAKLVPSDWLKVNSTKTHYRYRSPAAAMLMDQRQQGIERIEQGAYPIHLHLSRLNVKSSFCNAVCGAFTGI